MINRYKARYFQHPEDQEKVFKIFLGTEKSYKGLVANFIPGWHDRTLEGDFDTWKIFPNPADNRSWQMLLREAKDSDGLPVLAYALAGDISLACCKWLLKTLGRNAIQAYAATTPLSLLIIAATGPKDRFELLSQYYTPTEDEWREALFFSIYFGRQEITAFIIERFSQHQTIIELNSERDPTQNTFLHIAVLGKQKSLIDEYLSEQGYLIIRPSNMISL